MGHFRRLQIKTNFSGESQITVSGLVSIYFYNLIFYFKSPELSRRHFSTQDFSGAFQGGSMMFHAVLGTIILGS